MGLFKKIFSGGKRGPSNEAPPTTQFHESDSTASAKGSKNAPRRELVHVVLRDTMRLHGIPTDWIDCAILSVVRASNKTGLHVHLIVRHGHDRLLTYVPAFQTSFMEAVTKFDPRVSDWLMSLSWQFEGMHHSVGQRMPDPAVWTGPGPGLRTAGVDDESEIAQDLEALFAIRDAAMQPEPAPAPAPLAGHTDFEPTRPG